MQPRVQIVGGGFSGLVSAWALQRAGFQIEIFEARPRLGGMIATSEQGFGRFEAAANALLNTPAVTELFQDLKIPLCSPPVAARAKFIFRDRPRRWPLTGAESAKAMARGLWCRWGKRALAPRPSETVAEWVERTLGHSALEHLVTPALQGIYAGDPQRLSASLIFGRWFQPRSRHRSRPRGSVFPPGGMEELIEALTKRIQARGGQIHLNKKAIPDSGQPLILATSAPAAAEFCRPHWPVLAEQLSQIEMVSLVTAEAHFGREKGWLKGYGCLFSPVAQFSALGVLFEDQLFPHRFRGLTERWILGGALRPEILKLSDEEIGRLIATDRRRLGGQGSPDEVVVQRFSLALPHYTVNLERLLLKLRLPSNLHLMGNYLGQIGLSQILTRAQNLALQLRREHGH